MKKYISSALMFGIICAPIKPPVFVQCASTCSNQSQPPIINNNNGNNTIQNSGGSIPPIHVINNSVPSRPTVTVSIQVNHPGGCAPYIPGTSIHYQCWYDAQAAIALLNGTPKVVPHVLPPHPTTIPAPLPKPIYHNNSKG